MSATSSASYLALGNSLSVNISADTYAQDYSLTSYEYGAAYASTTLALDFYTPGPPRPGFLEATGPYGDTGFLALGSAKGSPGDGGANVRFSLTAETNDASIEVINFTCANNSKTGDCYVGPGLIPVELGTSLDFDGNAYADTGLSNTTAGLAQGLIHANFQFFEADGSTLVPVLLDTPEPGTSTLAGVALLMGVVSLRLRRS